MSICPYAMGADDALRVALRQFGGPGPRTWTRRTENQPCRPLSAALTCVGDVKRAQTGEDVQERTIDASTCVSLRTNGRAGCPPLRRFL